MSDDEARDRLAGTSWAVRLARQAECTLELLEADQAKLQEEMTSAQGVFAESLEVMEAVSRGLGGVAAGALQQVV